MISAIGQMLGAIGVIISIVYLAAQIRNQNKESQRQAMNVLTTHWSDLNRTLVENPEMAVLWLMLRDVSRTWMPSRSCGSARIWGVSCALPTASILTSWMERSTSDCGGDMSAQLPTLLRIPVSKHGGLHENTGTRTNSAR